jgi:hypothetical protein
MAEFVQLHEGGPWHRPSPQDDDLTICQVPILQRHAVTHSATLPAPPCTDKRCSTVPVNPVHPRLETLGRGISGNALPRRSP